MDDISKDEIMKILSEKWAELINEANNTYDFLDEDDLTIGDLLNEDASITLSKYPSVPNIIDKVYKVARMKRYVEDLFNNEVNRFIDQLPPHIAQIAQEIATIEDHSVLGSIMELRDNLDLLEQTTENKFVREIIETTRERWQRWSPENREGYDNLFRGIH